MTKSESDKPNIAKAKGIELAAVIIFILLIHLREKAVIDSFSGGQPPLQDVHVQNFLNSMNLGILPDQFWLLAWPLGLLAMGFLLFIRWRWYFLATVGLLTSLLLSADELYYKYFTSMLSAEMLMITGQLWDIRDSVISALTLMNVVHGLAFVLFAVFAWKLASKNPGRLNDGPKWFIVDKVFGLACALLAIYCLSVAYYIPARYVTVGMNSEITVYDQPTDEPTYFVPLFESSRKDYATCFGLFSFHLNNVVDVLDATWNPPVPTEEEITAVVQILEHKEKLNQTPSPYHGIAAGKNVFIVSLESLQHFLLDLDINGEPVMPNLRDLGEQGFRFDYIIDQTKMGGTSDAEFSLMTGLLADVRKIASLEAPVRNKLIAFPMTLREAGYHTASFHDNRASFWNRDLNHPRYGINEMVFEGNFSRDQKLGLGTPDDVFFRQSLEKLVQGQQPFFSFLIAISSHHPYPEVPVAYKDRFTSAQLEPQAERYVQLAAYVDEAIASLMDDAKEFGLWDNSIFVIYGDHIAPMEEKGITSFEERLGLSLREPGEMRIPMVIYAPGLEEAATTFKRDGTPIIGGLQDIFPTVLHLLGHPIPFGVYGTHLFVPGDMRDPVPLMRMGGHYFYKGVLYQNARGAPVRNARDGSLSYGRQEDLITSPREHEKLYQNVVQQMLTHFLFFDSGGQEAAIRKKAQ